MVYTVPYHVCIQIIEMMRLALFQQIMYHSVAVIHPFVKQAHTSVVNLDYIPQLLMWWNNYVLFGASITSSQQSSETTKEYKSVVNLEYSYRNNACGCIIIRAPVVLVK